VSESFVEGLRAQIGSRGGAQAARDPVNQPMIRHWCDAMEDHNPVYTDPAAAAKSVHGEIVAPPTMLNAWTMAGNIPRVAGSADPQSRLLQSLDAAGYSSVVATNSEHLYDRYLRIGDEISGALEVLDVSEEKQTGLGVGHFVTTDTEYRNQDGERVGSMLFRILKFKPGTGRTAPGAASTEELRRQRPRPGIIHETAFFWDGVAAGELRIQRCEGCGVLRHPPVVRCPDCGSYEFGYTVSSGLGHVYSFVEVHHPQVSAFDYPLTVALVELEEGTRLISNVVDVDPERVHVGMPVQLAIRDFDDGQALPLFRARRPERRATTLRFEEVEVGQELAPCPLPITPTLIVAGALASRDYQDVHHDRDLAAKRGSPNIFMNILTTGGLCGRFIGDWAGPEALMRNLRIRLGAPNYPGDCMTLCGSVKSKELRDGRGVVEVELRGRNQLGDHVTGTTELELPLGGGTQR
jgi:uncharacterized OB-fold protein